MGIFEMYSGLMLGTAALGEAPRGLLNLLVGEPGGIMEKMQNLRLEEHEQQHRQNEQHRKHQRQNSKTVVDGPLIGRPANFPGRDKVQGNAKCDEPAGDTLQRFVSEPLLGWEANQNDDGRQGAKPHPIIRATAPIIGQKVGQAF